MGGRAEPCVGHIPDRRDHGSDFRAADAVEMDAAHGADAAAEFGRRTFGKLGGEFALAVPVAVKTAGFAVSAQCRRADVRGVASAGCPDAMRSARRRGRRSARPIGAGRLGRPR